MDADQPTPTFVQVRARDIVPYKHAIWCTVGGCPEPFANEVAVVGWSQDRTQVRIMLESHNFIFEAPDAFVDCVVEQEGLSEWERKQVAEWPGLGES